MSDETGMDVELRDAEAADGDTRRAPRWKGVGGRVRTLARRLGRDRGSEAVEDAPSAETEFDDLQETGVVDLGGQSWMVGVFWGPELVGRGQGVKLCRERASQARMAAKRGEESPGVDDVSVVFEVERAREAWGVGSSSRGHEGGMGVLAAQVQRYFYDAEDEAEVEEQVLEWSARQGMICGFDMPGGGYYVVALQQGVVVGGTDVVLKEQQEARQLFMQQQLLGGGKDRGWLMVAPESWNLTDVLSQVPIARVVAGGPVVRARSRTEAVRKLVKLAMAAGGAAVVAWAVLQVVEDLGSHTSGLERELTERRRELQAQLRQLVPVEEYGEVFAVPAAPWEEGQVPEGRHGMGVCVSLVRNVGLVVPVEQLGRRVSRAVCSLSLDGRATLAVETVAAVGSQDARPLLRREGQFEGVNLRDVVAVTVPQVAEGRAWYGDVEGLLLNAPGSVMIREEIHVAEQAQTGKEAWAQAGFSVLLVDAPELLPTVREILLRPEVVISQVSYLVTERQWEILGWVAGVKPLLAEVRELERDTAETRAQNAAIASERELLQERIDSLRR